MSDSFSSLDSAVAHVEWCYIKAPLEHKVRIMLDPSSQLPEVCIVASIQFLTFVSAARVGAENEP